MNDSTPVVSVLMTAFNREKYIAIAIESVLASSYKLFELIIVDDGSKDNTLHIANKYALKDSRIRVYKNETNLGDYPNRNMAASYAKGKYLKYVDADDYIYPWGLEILVNCMEKFPEATWGLCSIEQNINGPYPFMLSSEQAYHQEYFVRGLLNRAPLSSIVQTSAFREVGGFTGKKHLGDVELWHLLAKKYSLVLMPHGIAWYRLHDEQQSNDNRTDPLVPFKYILFSLAIFNENNAIPMSEVNIEIVKKKIVKKVHRTILKHLLNFRFSIALKMIEMYKGTLKLGLNNKAVFN